MDPGTVGMRLASSVLGPLVRKLFVLGEGPGAGVVDKPIRISGYVSFRGEKRSLTPADVRRLAGRIVQHALRTAGERPVAADEEQAVVDALAATLCALGELRITDLDAVRLGAPDFARALRRAAGPDPARELGADAAYFYERLLDAACLHILHFFTQRSTFVAHTLVEQTRATAELTAKVDELIRRRPLPGAEDTGFEQEYLRYVTKKHGRLTIYGIDLDRSPSRWPLDVAYLSLEATSAATRERGPLALAFDQVPSEAELHHPASTFGAPQAPQPADQVLARNCRVLLRGEAGSGKSTLVQWLAVSAADQDPPPAMAHLRDRIPFVLPLRTVTRNGDRLPAPKDFLAAVDCPLAGSQPTGWEQRVLAAGRGLVLVDGIDEVPERERERTRRWLRDLMDTYGGDNRWLVTSRPSAVGERWLAEDGFGELTLSAMGTAEVATFVRRWHAAARPDAEDPAELDAYEEQLLAAVRTKPDLGRLATNPLMCGLICALHRDRRGYLPHGRKDLYEAGLSMLLSRRDRERDIEVPELGEDAQLDVLQRLAYWLIKNGRTEMDRSRAEDIIGRALPAVPELAALGDAAAVFDHFLLRSGLLREPAPDTVHFVHKTFQDFLGARAVVEEGDFGLLVDRAGNDQWEDVIRMAVALAKPRERAEILRGLIAAGDRAAGSDRRSRARVHLLAAACLEQATVLDPAVREAVQERTARLIPPTNEEEAHALAQVGPLVLGLLPEPEGLPDSTVRDLAITASNVTSDAAVPYLARLAGHPSLAVRSQLVWAWSRFDCAVYGHEVIARVDPGEGLRYTARSAEQLDLLSRLEPRPTRLDVRGDVPPEAVAAYAARTGLDELRLSRSPVTDLSFLAGQTSMSGLVLSGCTALADVSALSGLPLEGLTIAATPVDVGRFRVAALPKLRFLTLDLPPGAHWDFDALPGSLEDLQLSGSFAPPSAEAWRRIGELPVLMNLGLAAEFFESVPEGVVLPSVSRLRCRDGGSSDLQTLVDRVPRACPRVQIVHVTTDLRTVGADLDVAPLAGLPHLQAVILPVPAAQVRNAGTLPERVRLITL
ncbi:NACHT domain-containing NTPase [Streptomyces sp. WAC06614]|uniref:NACHT domain-containing protein n=1 Tax=Streptomyces sp. WAC06614 TaxID=2487416 RepID=UPI000F799B55|nr:NACHT domain-containing protein [Streptomyces sp. WAC06614]RSS78379.1 NACHT domain-containing protein [Streptomyces sp. WAC06614]